MKRLYVPLFALVVMPLRAEDPKAKALKEDPAATKLLADARAARAEWLDFPGFTADLEVNIDGRIFKGIALVAPTGDVKVNFEGDASKWATRQLASLAGHRLSDGGASSATPCAFPDDNVNHPLGRLVQVLNDEFHSSYRIRDRQVIVVNRTGRETRFTITVTETRLNEKDKFLPVSYVVNTWNAESGELRSSETFHQTWKRVGNLDLPDTLDIVTATQGKLEARTLRLSNHRLLKK
jgi:hypothetical protein